VGILRDKNRGFTLIEIIVASIILALTVAGIANLFVSGKRYIAHARWRMGGGEIGKYFLDPLQMNVRADQWGSVKAANAAGNCLAGNKTSNCPAAQAGYTPGYNITYDDPGGNVTQPGMARVKLEVNWTEN